MSSFSFIHAADIHLDSPLLGLSAYEGAPVELLRNATREAFINLIDEAIQEQVDFMVISGDLYDGGWKDFNTGLFFSKEMGRLNRENIPVFIVHGNHDAESELTKQLTLPDNVTIFSTKKAETHLIDNLEMALHGQSFRDAKTEENLALNYPPAVKSYFNIGVLHTSVEGHAAHVTYAPCSLSDLTDKGYDYWALGHVHEYKVLKEFPSVVFPGNIQGRHIRETGARGAVLVTVESGKPVVERLFVDTVRWHRIEIDASSADSLKDVVLLARDRLEKLLLEEDGGRPLAARIIFTGKSSVHGELFGLEAQLRQEILAVANMLSNDRLWIEKVVINTAPELAAADIELRSDAIADLQGILAKISTDPDIQQRIVDELMELVAKVPLELIDMVPELVEIQAGDITNQLEAVSLGLIAHMSGEEGAG
jgi:DNA repair exonuclease SbcCD nuclease subunit